MPVLMRVLKRPPNNSGLWVARCFWQNLPPDATERELSLFLKPHGTIERVCFSEDAQEKDTVEESDDSESDEEVDMETEGVVAEGEDTQPKKRRRLNKTKPPQPPQVIPLPTKPLRTLRHTGQTAHVVFLDSSSLERALVPPTKPRMNPQDWHII